MEMDRILVVFTCCLLSSTSVFADAYTDYVPEVMQNLKAKSNSELNIQVTAYQRTSLIYLAYASYFDRGNIDLPGFRKFFQAASHEVAEDSQKVIDYINLRGGQLHFSLLDMKFACDMTKTPPDLILESDRSSQICEMLIKRDQTKKSKKPKHVDDWQNGLMALIDALNVERVLNSQLLVLAQNGAARQDNHLRHFIEDSFLGQQTARIKKLVDLIARLRQYTESDYPLGEYVLDVELSA